MVYMVKQLIWCAGSPIYLGKRSIKKVLTYKCKLGLFDAPRGIRTPDRRGTGNHRSIQLSYGRMNNILVIISSYVHVRNYYYTKKGLRHFFKTNAQTLNLEIIFSPLFTNHNL